MYTIPPQPAYYVPYPYPYMPYYYNVLPVQPQPYPIAEINQPTKLTEEHQGVKTESERDTPHDSESDHQDNLSEKFTNQIGDSKKFNPFVKSTNVQKNFAKAIVSFACKNRKILEKLLGQETSPFLRLMNSLKNKLRNVTHITQHTEDEKYLLAFRIISQLFLRKESVAYIYNSKIHQKTSHLKSLKNIKKSILKL
ncbi:hypothetical protein pb186bvf_015354 [Paramecium bursaria]